ncbi:MAG TPA: RNA polymerase sigma factor [Polyangiales bacterium]
MSGPLRPALRAQDGGELPTAAEPVRLIARVVDGRAQLERTLLQLIPGVRSLLFRMLGPRPDLDDATQDALIELASALPQFAGDSSLATFARSVTVRVGYRYFKRRAPHVELDAEQHAAHGGLPDAELAQRRALLRLHRCLAKLPDKRRVAFVLCGIEGLSADEAAATLGVQPGAVRSRYMHAREELKRLLSAHGREELDG